MRVLAASFVGLIGLGAIITMGACSDSTDTGNAGGAGGASGGSTAGSSSAGAHSAGASGSSADAGAAGAAPAGQCTFTSDACQACLGSKCAAQVGGCLADTACKESLSTLPNCVCDPNNTSDSCQASFVTDGGDPAVQLAMCYTLNCMAACE